MNRSSESVKAWIIIKIAGWVNVLFNPGPVEFELEPNPIDLIDHPFECSV